MSAEQDEPIVIYDVQSCEPGEFYDRGAQYSTQQWPALCRDIKAEVDRGRCVLIEREVVMRSEFEARPEIEGLQPFGE